MSVVVDRIKAYTDRWRFAQPDEVARRFEMRILRSGSGYVGQFDVGEGLTGRIIRSESCDDVALGLAVAVALALDPPAGTDAAPTPTPRDPSEHHVEPADEEPREAAPPPALDVPSPPAERTAAPRARSRSTSSPAISAGARVDANSAISSVVGVVVGFLEAEWQAPSERVPWLRPVGRVGARQSLPRVAQAGASRAELWWTVGFLELCPTRVTVISRVSAELCLGANVGALSAQPRDIPGAAVTRRWWLDYGGALGLRWQPHPHAFAETVAGAWIPVTRDRLRVEPDGIVTQAPRFGVSLGIGAGWRF